MNITKDIKYIGVNDHDLDLFEGQYTVPNGMAYNSYAIVDEKIAIMASSNCCVSSNKVMLSALPSQTTS